MNVTDRVARVKAQYPGCFGCGRANARGHQLDGFETDGERIRAPFSARPEYCGFDGIPHGGIVATALDEILGWTATVVEGEMAVTAKLEIRYLEPGARRGHIRA